MPASFPPYEIMDMKTNNNETAMETTSAVKDLPFAIKKKLMEISGHVATPQRAEFLRRTASRLGELAHEHPRTIVFGVSGFVIGLFIEHLTTFPWGDGSIFGDLPSKGGALAGTGYGFWKDREVAAVQQRTTRILREELLAAGLFAR